MLDSYWLEVQDFITTNKWMRPISEWAICLPEGDWEMDGQLIFYSDRKGPGPQVESGYSDVVIVSKGKLPILGRKLLTMLSNTYAAVFANEVFVVYFKPLLSRPHFSASPDHLLPIDIFLNPLDHFRAKPKRAAFMHIPKNAGTSFWDLIVSQVSSNIYFPSDEALLQFDGNISDYEVVGGHFRLKTILACGWQYPVFCILRDPIERSRSAIRHVLTEYNRSSLSPEMRQLVPESDRFSAQLFHELNMQSIFLGLEYGKSIETRDGFLSMCNEVILSLSQPNLAVAILSDPQSLSELFSGIFGVDCSKLRHLNARVNSIAKIADYDREQYGNLPSFDEFIYSVLSGRLPIFAGAGVQPGNVKADS